MIDLIANLNAILHQIHLAENKHSRPLGSVALLAVSKSHAPTQIEALYAAGQQSFGENYVKEALIKISALQDKQIDWHFIGPVQTNKAKEIAQNFSWVHTICRIKEAQLLSQHRDLKLGPLNILIQVKLDDNPKKSGIAPHAVPDLIAQIRSLPHLTCRGLMALPPFTRDFMQQRHYFNVVKTLFTQLNQQGAKLDTLSMGMTDDLEAAIAEGATIVRIGTGIFGPREGKTL